MEIPKNNNDVVWDKLTKGLLEKVLTERKFVNEFELTSYIDSKLEECQESVKNNFWDRLYKNNEFKDLLLENNKDRIDSVIASSPEDAQFKTELRKIECKDPIIKETISTKYWTNEIKKIDDTIEKVESTKNLEKENEKLKIDEIRIKTKIDKYIKTLNEEADKSPMSSNLKTYVKIFGHKPAFEYFQSDDYNSRQESLDNRTPQELDIQKSRHYIEGKDYSPTSSTNLNKDLIEKIIK